MINHVRTLLMNRGRDGHAFDFPGEEFVPAEFVPRRLPVYLRSAHRALFGTNPDRLYLNYRLRQLMSMLHATELEEHVLAFDSRVTYLPLTRDDMFRSAFEPVITSISGNRELTVEGTHTADEGAGRCYHAWRVTATAPDQLVIVRQTPPPATFSDVYTIANGLSNRIQLPGSPLYFRFKEPLVEASWLVSSNARPERTLDVTLTNLKNVLTLDGLAQLFPPLAAEPIRTYYQVWNNHPLTIYRFSALLLAMVTKMDTLPQEQT